MGACPKCQGFGNTIDYDLDLIVPDPTLSLEEGAVDPWTKPQYTWYYDEQVKPRAQRESTPERRRGRICARRNENSSASM